MFRCLDFMIKHKWAVTENFEKVIKFIAGLGVRDLQEHLDKHFQSATPNYLSSDTANQLVTCLSNLLEKQLLQDLCNKEFALLADKSTNMANRSQLCVMARFVSDSGAAKTQFLGMVQLSKGNSEYIMNTLEGFLLAKSVEMTNIRFMAFDGCNMMSGVQKGLQRRIRHVSPFAIYLNCRNHRLALCLVHLLKIHPILQDVDNLLMSLWKMFEYSPRKMAVFKHIQQEYGTDSVTLTRAATTRWLSHLQASSRFISRYTCLIDTVDALYNEKREPEIRHSLTEKKVVAAILLLCDILKPLHFLSLYLQQEEINFTALPDRVKDTVDSLQGLMTQYKHHMDNHNLDESDLEFGKCLSLFTEIDDRTTLSRQMRGDCIDIQPETFLQEIGMPLIHDLIQELQSAFDTGAPVLKSFGFFNPQNLPESFTNFSSYGL